MNTDPLYYRRASDELNDLADRLDDTIGLKLTNELRDRAYQLAQASKAIKSLRAELRQFAVDLRDPQ